MKDTSQATRYGQDAVALRYAQDAVALRYGQDAVALRATDATRWMTSYSWSRVPAFQPREEGRRERERARKKERETMRVTDPGLGIWVRSSVFRVWDRVRNAGLF